MVELAEVVNMKIINIFGNDVIVRDHLCSSNPNDIVSSKPSLRLYIKLTDSCKANCSFCANRESRDFGELDLKKLEYVISYLKDNNILHGISITGGEPMTNPSKLYDLLSLIWKVCPGIEVAISTSGYNLKMFLQFDNVNNLESIHISRHHYDDSVNREIFKTNDIASTSEILYLQDFLEDKKIININTMVMKGYIDSLEEIKKMLNYVGDLGVYKNGFVSLMKCNQYSIDHFINFNDIFNHLDSNFFNGHHFYNKYFCECVDGVYLTYNKKLVEYYARMVKECKPCETSSLVYTTDNKVTEGFSDKVLFK